MNYIILSKNAYFIVDQKGLTDFQYQYGAAKGSMIPFHNQFIDKFGIEIFELPFYLKNENEKLRIKGLCRCKYCGRIKNLLDKCGCSDDKELRKNNEFALGDAGNALQIASITKQLK